MHHANKALIPALKLRIFGISAIINGIFVGLQAFQQVKQRVWILFPVFTQFLPLNFRFVGAKAFATLMIFSNRFSQ